jgi:hypothetical protein
VAVTFNDLANRVKQQLLGYTKDQASVSQLTHSMTATDTTFSVDPDTVTNLSRGLVEIGDEMILVKKFDKASGLVTVMGGLNGRGAESTTASVHAVDDLVTDDPRFPRTRVKEAINDTIRATYPDLWVFGQYEFPYVAARYEYPIPAEAEDVYKVTINTIGPSRVWFPSQKWRFNPLASTGAQVAPTPTPTGKTIQIYDFVVPGRDVRVMYRKPPSTLVNNSDDFATVTGYPERYIDMITYGAVWHMKLPGFSSRTSKQPKGPPWCRLVPVRMRPSSSTRCISRG